MPGHLRTGAESALANAIGVSTLAVTADGAFVLVRGSPGSTWPARCCWPPPGVARWIRGISAGRRAATLQDILRRGMHRELREETAIRPDEIKGTTVTGFARWLDRGAKPEFFGLTQLSVTGDDLAGAAPWHPAKDPTARGRSRPG